MKGSQYFKIRSWIDERTYKTFVFIGDDYDENVSKILDKLGKCDSPINVITQSDKRHLTNAFGTRYERALAFDEYKVGKVSYIKAIINKDDNIGWLKKKLYAHLHKDLNMNSHESLYIWLNKRIHVSSPVFQTFITNSFKTEKRISYDYFRSCVWNFFEVSLPNKETQFIDKLQAIDLIKDIKTAQHVESVFFKYANDTFFEYLNYNPLKEKQQSKFDDVDILNNISYDSMLFESFGLDDVIDKCLNIISFGNFQRLIKDKSDNQKVKLINKYFPSEENTKGQDYQSNTLKFVEVIEKAEMNVHNHKIVEGHKIGSFINFLHLRVNELNFNKKQDLESLFENFTTNSDIPFIKYKSINNNYYKVHKESILNVKNNLLGKWTETAQSQFGKTNDTTYVLFKMNYTKDIYCSLLVFDNLCYDVKFSFGNMMRETEANIVGFLKRLDVIIGKISKIYPTASIPVVDKDFSSFVGGENNTKVLRWLTTNTIKSDKHNLNYNNFVKVIQNRLFSYFNMIRNPNKNILHLQYKKVDNYLKYENIQVFITNNFVKDREDMLKKIVNEFVISKEDAEKEYEKWTSQNQLEILKMGDKVFIKPKNDNFVNIKIRLTSSIDLNFNIEGAKSQTIQKRIIHLLLVLMDMSADKINDKAESFANKVEKLDSFIYGTKTPLLKSPKSPLGLGTPGNLGGDDAFMFDDFETYDGFGDMFEDDDDLKALELEFLKEVVTEAHELKKVNKKSDDKDEDDDLNGVNDEDAIMKSYFMNMLKSADRELIDYKVPKGDKSQKRYSTVCQWNDRRQPVVVNQTEFKKVQQFHKDIKYIKTGSTPDMQERNHYICPQVWCPKSKIALTYKDFKEKYNESCPYPDIEEKPILLTNHYWGKGEKGQSREHFPGFLDAFTHPKKFCLPCCFKKEAKEGSKNKQKENTCKNQWNTDVVVDEEPEIIGNEKYIKAEIVVPLEVSRFGLLPKDFNELLGNKLCGNGLDGKGLMSDKTDCILRRGVFQKSQSFINALITLLDNPQVTNIQSFLDKFNSHVSIDRFVALENGKIMKLFINRDFDIFESKNFQSFVSWFLSDKQKNYIKQFKLFEIAQELSKLQPNSTFDTSKLAKHKTILREFLIYNAYINFIDYMNNGAVEKNYSLLIDFVQTETKWLNIKNFNIVVIEHEPSEGKTHMVCPFNRNAKSIFDLSDPFVFIFKQNNYYEPLGHVRIVNGDIKAQTNFLVKTAPPSIKKLIQFYMQNCSLENTTHFAQDIELFLKSLGFKLKRYVIDYSFRVTGFLVSQHNLFIPLKHKVDIYDLQNSEFIYYDEISKYHCTLSSEQLEMVFKELYKHTADAFYKLNIILESMDGKRIVGVILNKDFFVPVNYLEEEDIKYISEILEDDLNIFIENEKVDVRKSRISRDNESKKLYQLFSNEISNYISNHKSSQSELSFLTDATNPFPKDFKRKKIIQLMKVIIDESKIIDRMRQSGELDTFTSRYVEDILNASGNVYNMVLKQLFGIKKKFKKAPSELLFDQKDVLDGKLIEKIKFIQNPYTSLVERLDKHMKEYVVDLQDYDELEHFKRYINPDTVYEDVPYKFRKILQGYQLITYELYTPNSIYDVFLRICKARNLTNITDITIMRSIILKELVTSYRESNMELFLENPSFTFNEKSLKLKKKTLENCVTILDSMSYYPSFFELYVLSRVARINVIIIGRKRKNNDEGIDMYYNKSSKYVIFEHSYDRFNYHDVFKLVIKGPKGKTPKILYRKHEISVPLMELLGKAKRDRGTNV
jgi:hypothetical protein